MPLPDGRGRRKTLTCPFLTLMFVATGKGDKWMEVSYRFAENMPNIKTIELDCDHYVFHYEADKMTDEIGLFLDDL